MELIGGVLLLGLVYLGIGKVVSFINARKVEGPTGENKDSAK